MSRLYRDKRWIEFRESIFEIDGHTCVKCARSFPDVILQVHHVEYRKGKPPWDYPAELCETLCKGCHARTHGEVRPAEGWELYAQDDLGSLDGECELCGEPIRYVFHIDHPNWEPMIVGTVCCDNLTGTQEATEYRKFLNRQNRFLSSSRWKISVSGIFLKQNCLLEIEIFPKEKHYCIRINDVSGRKKFDSVHDAKKHVFELIQNGKAQEFAIQNPRVKR